MYNKKQRTAALIAVILIIILIIALLVTAITDSNGQLFRALLFAVIAVPILAWIYIWLFGKLTGKKTIADFDRDRKDILHQDTASARDGDDKNAEPTPQVTISKNPFLKKDQ